MSFLEEFKDGLTLKQWLSLRDITIDEFAKKIGVSRVTVINWRNGKNLPKLKYIKKIEEVLNTDFKSIKF